MYNYQYDCTLVELSKSAWYINYIRYIIFNIYLIINRISRSKGAIPLQNYSGWLLQDLPSWRHLHSVNSSDKPSNFWVQIIVMWEALCWWHKQASGIKSMIDDMRYLHGPDNTPCLVWKTNDQQNCIKVNCQIFWIFSKNFEQRKSMMGRSAVFWIYFLHQQREWSQIQTVLLL